VSGRRWQGLLRDLLRIHCVLDTAQPLPPRARQLNRRSPHADWLESRDAGRCGRDGSDVPSFFRAGPGSLLRSWKRAPVSSHPENAEIFLDGYYVGTADDFDGMFQRLRLAPGEHDIELYLSGYRSVRQKILVQPGATFRVRYSMEALKPGDTSDPRPVAPAPAVRNAQTKRDSAGCRLCGDS